jgi:uncharacterized protein (UPF0218 family)
MTDTRKKPDASMSMATDILESPKAVEAPGPHLRAETIIVDQEDRGLALIEAFLWPPVGAVVELGKPTRGAVVRKVRLRLAYKKAQVLVTVEDVNSE